jgi:hypothetical protein
VGAIFIADSGIIHGVEGFLRRSIDEALMVFKDGDTIIFYGAPPFVPVIAFSFLSENWGPMAEAEVGRVTFATAADVMNPAAVLAEVLSCPFVTTQVGFTLKVTGL